MGQRALGGSYFHEPHTLELSAAAWERVKLCYNGAMGHADAWGWHGGMRANRVDGGCRAPARPAGVLVERVSFVEYSGNIVGRYRRVACIRRA